MSEFKFIVTELDDRLPRTKNLIYLILTAIVMKAAIFSLGMQKVPKCMIPRQVDLLQSMLGMVAMQWLLNKREFILIYDRWMFEV